MINEFALNFFTVFISILITGFAIYALFLCLRDHFRQILRADRHSVLKQKHFSYQAPTIQPTYEIKGENLKSDLNIPLTFEYHDYDGVITDRDIIIKEIIGKMYGKTPYPIYIKAWCLLRQDTRHFRIDRILKLQNKEKNFSISESKCIHQYFLSEITGNKKEFHYDYTPPLEMTIYLADGHIHQYKMNFMESFGCDTIRTRGYSKRITPDTRGWSGSKSFYNNKNNLNEIHKINYESLEFNSFFSLKEHLHS